MIGACVRRIGVGVGKATRACLGRTGALDGGNGGVGLGAGEAIGAHAKRPRALDGCDGGVGLGVGEAFGARIKHAAEVTDAQG